MNNLENTSFFFFIWQTLKVVRIDNGEMNEMLKQS